MNNIGKSLTNSRDLERHILDYNTAKSEAEWWARKRILELEKRLEMVKSVLDINSTLITRLRNELADGYETDMHPGLSDDLPKNSYF